MSFDISCNNHNVSMAMAAHTSAPATCKCWSLCEYNCQLVSLAVVKCVCDAVLAKQVQKQKDVEEMQEDTVVACSRAGIREARTKRQEPRSPATMSTASSWFSFSLSESSHPGGSSRSPCGIVGFPRRDFARGFVFFTWASLVCIPILQAQ